MAGWVLFEPTYFCLWGWVMTAMEAQQELRHTVLRVSTGGLSYEEGKAQAGPLLDIINTRGKEIAKKYKKSYRPLTWGFALRYGL
jgi:hypothetical protein